MIDKELNKLAEQAKENYKFPEGVAVGEINGNKIRVFSRVSNSHTGKKDAFKLDWRLNGKRISFENLKKFLEPNKKVLI